MKFYFKFDFLDYYNKIIILFTHNQININYFYNYRISSKVSSFFKKI